VPGISLILRHGAEREDYAGRTGGVKGSDHISSKLTSESPV